MIFNIYDKNILWINFFQKIAATIFLLIIFICVYGKHLNSKKIQKEIYLYNDSLKVNNKENLTNGHKDSSKVLKNIKRKQVEINLNNGKLYWNNQISLEINKTIEEIKSYKHNTISFDQKTDFIRKDNPKISLIIALHNNKKNIKSIYASIQKQELKDIEIIFVDDNSNDNSTIIIKELMKRDKRIVFLKNEVNRGAFYSRNKGILQARGEYILVIDPDDLLINNILIKIYETAKQFNLDIVQFYVLRGYFESPKLWKILKNKGGILKNNKEIRNNFYYGNSWNLWDKLVRKNIYIKSIHFMDKQFYNQLYYVNNDNTAIFGLIHVANTYGFLEEIGYFYIMRPKNSYYYRFDHKNMNIIFQSIFNNMRYFYIQSDNNSIEKTNLAYKYFYIKIRVFGKYLPYVTVGFDYFLDILNLYNNSSYFSDLQKKRITEFKLKIIDRKKNINKLNKDYLVHLL